MTSNPSTTFHEEGSYPGPATSYVKINNWSNAGSSCVRPGGPPNPIPAKAGRCHHIHSYSAAQHDPKISNMKLSPGPLETWNAGHNQAISLDEFLHTIKPSMIILEGRFSATSPNTYNIYR